MGSNIHERSRNYGRASIAGRHNDAFRRTSQHLLKKSKLSKREKMPFWARMTACFMVSYIVFLVYSLASFGRTNLHQSHLGRGNSKYPPFLERKGGVPLETKDERTGKNQDDGASIRKIKTEKRQTPTFHFDKNAAEAALQKHGAQHVRKILTAYLEPPLNDTVPGTGNQGNTNDEHDVGQPPEFIIPLPLRQTTPQDLYKVQYPSLQTCLDIPSKLPVDRGFQLDENGNMVVWNVGNTPTSDTFPMDEAPYCPVDADPFLPWLHDVFPSVDGTSIIFIAQNKRRCKTGKEFKKDLKRLEPQVALMQPVSIKRLAEQEATRLAPELWTPNATTIAAEDTFPRYRLAPLEESDPDGQFTRFICRFHTTDFETTPPRSVILGETLSVYPFNYEYVSWRKSQPTMITPRGQDNKFFWLSHLRFECPVPSQLQSKIVSGDFVLSDDTSTLWVDVIPIRTSPRYGTAEVYFTEEMAGPRDTWGQGDARTLWKSSEVGFDAAKRWGNRHVLPRVEASGRWENVPICVPPRPGRNHPESATAAVVSSEQDEILPAAAPGKTKPFLLSACVWTSASFKTRGLKKGPISDTLERLEEWLEFHFMVGFDHVFVYDNSGASTNTTSLQPILDKYPPSKVTRIDWPSIVCNNNIPAHDNTGERSSQYAAENSCRTRFAPFTEWIASIDTDEYLIPMGKYQNMKDVVRDAAKKGTNILSFRSTRAKLRHDKTKDLRNGRIRLENYTFLETFNCDSEPIPKPEWADRARKQLYRADYVPYHFVHYSTVTNGLLTTYKEGRGRWSRAHKERRPSERITDESNEAIMLHAKTTTVEDCGRWKKRCHYAYDKKWQGCRIGFPWPNNVKVENGGDGSHRQDGMEYNCFPIEKLTSYWIPRLNARLLEKRKKEQSK